MGLALVEGDAGLLRQSLTGFLSGTAMIVAISVGVGLVHRDVPLGHEVMARTQPALLDLSVAFFSGMAGTIAIISPRLSAALVGIAISTAIVPPMAAAGLLAARGLWPLAGEAALLVLINIIAIQLATSIVLWFCGVAQLRRVEQSHTQVLVRNIVSIGVVLLLASVLLAQLHEMVQSEAFKTRCAARLRAALQPHAGAHLAEVRFESTGKAMLVRAVVRVANAFTAEDVAAMEKTLPSPPGGERVELRVRMIPVNVMTTGGPLFNDEANWDAVSVRP